MNNIRKIALCLTLLVVFASVSIADDTGKFTFPEYKKFKLENGLTVYMMERKQVPLIYASFVFRVGSVNDGKKYGLANITATALMFGAGEKSKGDIEEFIDFHGANLGSGGGMEDSSLAGSFHKKDSAKFFGLMKDILTSPKFDKEEFDKYISMTKMRLKNAKETPQGVIGSYFSKFMFGSHPYGNPGRGTIKSIEGITLDDVKAFHASYYHPQTASLAVVGDFEYAEMEKQIRDLFADWKGKGEPARLENLADKNLCNFDKSRVLLINKDDSMMTTFLIGSKGVKKSNPDAVSIQLINTILGGRFTSWLNSELRIKSGLTYGANSSFGSMKDGGYFIASSFTATPTTEKALDLAMAVFDKLQTEGIDEETLRSGKNYMKGNFPRRYESSNSLVGFLNDMFIYGMDESYINTFSQKLEEVDVAKAKELIKKYFPKENMQFVFAGKGEAIRELAKKFGEVTELDIKEEEYLNK